MAFVMLTTVISSLFGIINPVMSKIFMDRLLTGQNLEWLMPFIGVMTGLAVVQLIVAWVQTIYNLTMPMGMQTLISEGQGGISGGQKQRIMIARAIAPKPKILMFDEATSALDNKTQKQVSEALDAMGCTRIVIAHRLSTIQHCDRILVLDKGSIIEDGTYEELIQKGGYFAELVERQRLDIQQT